MSDKILEIQGVSKFFGSVIALQNVSMFVRPGEVTCLLGDNGAGKSTLIKTLAGVHKPSEGKYFFEGKETLFESPREALNAGIATVYQDLAMIPLMSIWRNFFLGSEPLKAGPIFDIENAKRITREEMAKMGIDIRDPDQPVGRAGHGASDLVVADHDPVGCVPGADERPVDAALIERVDGGRQRRLIGRRFAAGPAPQRVKDRVVDVAEGGMLSPGVDDHGDAVSSSGSNSRCALSLVGV